MGNDFSRSFGDIKNNTFGPNSNIGGDDVNQVNVKNEPIIKESLDEIKNKIEKIVNEDSKNEAKVFYSSLENYIKEKNSKKIKTCISKLRTIIGDTSGLVTIAGFFGIGLPGL